MSKTSQEKSPLRRRRTCALSGSVHYSSQVLTHTPKRWLLSWRHTPMPRVWRIPVWRPWRKKQRCRRYAQGVYFTSSHERNGSTSPLAVARRRRIATGSIFPKTQVSRCRERQGGSLSKAPWRTTCVSNGRSQYAILISISHKRALALVLATYETNLVARPNDQRARKFLYTQSTSPTKTP